MRRSISSPLAASLLALAGLAASASEQPPATESYSEQVNVSEVLLDVIVTDSQGNVIVGLTPQDFKITEDGKPVELTGATFYSSRRFLGGEQELAKASGAIDTVPKSRYFILFFEEQQRANADNPGLGLIQRQLEAVRESKKWVQHDKQLDDFVAVVSYDTKLKLHQDFTQDARAVLAGIDSAAKGADPGSNWPSRQAKPGEISLRAGLPTGRELDKKTTRLYDALSVLADASKGIVGRKNVIFFGMGFGDLNSFGLYQPDPRYYPPMIQSLNSANVAVYTLDIVPNNVEYQLSNSLHQLASETGGRFFDNFTSFLTPLQQIGSENSGYYLLAYRSAHPSSAKGYQRVKIESKNPEFQVRSREGYSYGG